MGGFGGSSSGGKEGPRNEQKKAKKSNPIKDYIASGGLVGAVVKGFKNIGTKQPIAINTPSITGAYIPKYFMNLLLSTRP